MWKLKLEEIGSTEKSALGGDQIRLKILFHQCLVTESI